MPQPATHGFIIQDNGTAANKQGYFHFVQLPSLYTVGSDYQLIFKARLSSDSLSRYWQIKNKNPDKTFVLRNKGEQAIDVLLRKDYVEGYLVELSTTDTNP